MYKRIYLPRVTLLRDTRPLDIADTRRFLSTEVRLCLLHSNHQKYYGKNARQKMTEKPIFIKKIIISLVWSSTVWDQEKLSGETRDDNESPSLCQFWEDGGRGYWPTHNWF